jgi:hypothetical protein
MSKPFLFAFVALLILCSAGGAQSSEEGSFGCPGPTQFFDHLTPEFVPIRQNAIERWKEQPGITFGGFDEARYGFQQAVIYIARSEVQQANPDADQGPIYRLAMAVQLSGGRGEHWYQMVEPQGNTDTAQSATPPELLEMQANADMLGGANRDESSPLGDLGSMLNIRRATPSAGIPVFVFDFGYRTAGVEAQQVVSNRLLMDIRSGKPQLSREAQCVPRTAGGACDSPDQPKAGYDNLHCTWQQSAEDFRCTLSAPYGGEFAARAASRTFYLLSGRPALPEWYTDQTPADLRALVLELSTNPDARPAGVMIPGLGPVTLLGRYKDVLPHSEVFIFASPGAGATLNAHLSLVTVSARGSVAIEAIPKWALSGEKTDEGSAPAGYTPQNRDDKYHITPLEDRAGFHALEAIMTSNAQSSANADSPEAVHIVYWIGVEAVNGKLVASAVRVASDGSTYGSCAADAHDGTAISVEQQGGMAAATVHVRPAVASVDLAPPQPDDAQIPSGCVWVGALYWKQGSGFHVRKTEPDCDAGTPHVSITEDGQISVRDESGEQQQN